MAVAIVTSFLQICDSNGDPVSGAKINVYAAGTTTPLSLFSDTGLSVGTANPIVCDAYGRSAMTYIATQTYKIVVTKADNSSLYTSDNIDPGVPVGAGALAIANGGTGATTAGGARTNLGVPSQTEFDSLSSDVVSLQSSLNAITGVPQGRLTVSSGTPVISSDVSASTNVYYTPYIGAQIPIWNSTAFITTTFSELTLALVSNHVASTIYDLFVINDSGTIRLVSGPAWNVSTAGSGARGSGAGTTELTRQSGILVNANTMTGRYGATTVSVPAKQGTYVGSMFMDGTNGQLTCHVSYGQSRKFGLWNAYNRHRIILKEGDATASWTYASGTLRQARADATNVLTVFNGLPEEYVTIDHIHYVNASTATLVTIAIGVNSTTTASGTSGQIGGWSNGGVMNIAARHSLLPSIGINNINPLEASSGATSTFFGTELQMLLTAAWNG